MLRVLRIGIAVLLMASALAAVAPAQRNNSSQKGTSLSPKELFKLRHDSVVKVVTDQGEGTGFIVKNGLLVATCYHVIDNAKSIQVLGTNDTKWSVGAVYFDKDNDAAILKLTEDSKRTPIPVGDLTKMSPGDEVFVIGNPLGLEQSITNGILSAKRKLKGVDVIQMTAAISPGSSGSPLFNNLGEFIGFVSFHFKDSQMVNMAIAAPSLVRLWQETSIPIQTFYASAKSEEKDEDGDDPLAKEKPKYSPAEAKKLFEEEFPKVISDIGVAILQWKINWYIEYVSSTHDVKDFREKSGKSYGLLLDAFERYSNFPDVIVSLDLSNDEKNSMLEEFEGILNDGHQLISARADALEATVNGNKDPKVIDRYGLTEDRLGGHIYKLVDFYVDEMDHSFSDFRKKMNPCVALYLYGCGLVDVLPDPNRSEGCYVAFSPVGSDLKIGNKITGIRQTTDSKFTTVGNWRELQDFLNGLQKSVTKVVVSTEDGKTIELEMSHPDTKD